MCESCARDNLRSVYVITAADACNGGAAAVPAIVSQPAPAAAAPDDSAAAAARVAGGIVGGLIALFVILAVVFRKRIVAAVSRCSGSQQPEQPFQQVVMGETQSPPAAAPNPYDTQA